MWKYRKGLDTLKSYSIDERDWDIRLDANESPFNLPPLVAERLLARLSRLPFNRYPEISAAGLKEQIAARFSLPVDNIQVGSGSSEILMAVCQAVGGDGHTIVFPTPSFSMYPIYAHVSDSVAAPVQLEEDFSLSPDKLLKTARATEAALVILCNPNNPTGTGMPPEDVERIVAEADCPVLVDEAYHEFNGESAVHLVGRYDNVMITRTFSKAYGLASARVGYMLGAAELVRAAGKMLMPYHVNALSLTAAETVFQMRDEFVPYIEQIIAEREHLSQQLRALPGIAVYPSKANFILLKLDDAGALAHYLAERSLSVRDFSSAPGLKNCLRVTVGTPVENTTFIQAVEEFLKRG
jgi:histidinol-phosphate aminotransferase